MTLNSQSRLGIIVSDKGLTLINTDELRKETHFMKSN